MDISLGLMTGIDIPIPEIQGVIHQPTIKEISYIGEQNFFVGLQTIMVNKNMLNFQDKTILESTNNFQIFMTIIQQEEMKDKKEAVLQFLQLIFPRKQIILTPASVLLSETGEQLIIDISNFEIVQKYINRIFCIDSSSSQQSSFNPADEKAKAIAEKLMRGRQRVAAQKGENIGSILARYLSILTIGLNSMSLCQIMSLTLYQLYDLVERYTLYLNWDLDIKTRLAGGKPDSQSEDWMKNIH